jgi:hypothetical protein
MLPVPLRLALPLTILACLVSPRPACADPDPLGAAISSEWSAAAVAPADFSVADYALLPTGERLRGVHLVLEPDSLEWVRLPNGLELPRAVAVLDADDLEAATVTVAGSTASVPISRSGHGHLAIPIPLLSGPDHALRIRLRRSGVDHEARFEVGFRPLPAHRGAVLIDASCSAHGIAVRRGSIPPDSWIGIACRSVPVQRAAGQATTLTVALFWDNAGPEVALDGVPFERGPDGTWSLRLHPRPRSVRLAARDHEIVIGHALPPRWHAAFVGAGVGPYLYRYHDADTDLDSAANLVTVYGAYTVSPTTRLVYFNAIPVHHHSYSDQGLYLWTEQFRLLDDRIGVNLLLGFHMLLFRAADRLRFVPSLPQGMEASFSDFGRRGHNLLAGAFYYPEISSRSYLNFWIRWGSPWLFGELNYIAWKEPVERGTVQTESLGFSVGLPLFRFF